MKEIVKNAIMPKMANRYEREELRRRRAAVKDVLDLGLYFTASLEALGIREEDTNIPKGLSKNTKIVVTEQALSLIGMTIEEAAEAALANYVREHGEDAMRPKGMDEVARAVGADLEEIPGTEGMMWIMPALTKDGAVVMAMPERIAKVAEDLGDDLYIIPSSKHEIILVPAKGMADPEEFEKFIGYVNDTQVEDDDILSYSMYCYRRSDGEISMLADGETID